MKAMLLLAQGALALVGVAGAIPSFACAPAPPGLISWWAAENDGADRVGGNPASMLNGASFADGQVGAAFNFDGLDDRVLVSNTPSLNFGPGQDFSIEAWIQPVAATTDFGVQSIVNKRLTPSFLSALGYEFHLVNGRLACQLADAPLTTLDFTSFESPGPDLRDGQFHHVAMTVDRDSPTGGKLYADGAVVLTFDPTVQPGDLTNDEPLRIGNHADPALNAHFRGRIDEVAIYNRALSSNEVAGIFLAGSAGKCAPPPPPQCIPAPPGLLSWWRGENSTVDAVDGNPGAIAGTGRVSYGPGVVGQAFVFDGIHRDRVDVGNPLNLQLEDFTIEAWVKRSSPTVTSFDVLGADGSVAGDGACIFGYGRGGYIFALANDGRMILSRTDLDGLFSAPLVTDTNWHHLAVTKSGSAAVFYVDGAPQATPAYVHPSPYTFDDATCDCNAAAAIGSRGDGRGGTFFGMIDEPAVFNRGLSPAEIQAIYAAGSTGKCVVSNPPLPSYVLTGPVTNSANGHWYYLLDATNWPAAEQIAMSLGGHLATVNNAAENDWIFTTFSTFGGIERTLWIGLNDAGQEWIWFWASGQPATYLNWAPGEPNNGGGFFADEDHVLIWHPSSGHPLGSWADAPSNQLHSAVVEVGPPEPIILAGPVINPANDHSYYLLNYTNWPAAEQIAVSLGGHLATINDAAENTWIFNTFSTFGGLERPLWIGLTDSAQEGNWVWVSGEPVTYLNWSPIEPNTGGGVFPDEDHAMMWHPSSGYPLGSWNDGPSNHLEYAVVEVAGGGTPCAGNTSGLVGLWRGESNAEDAVLGNHGTLTNGTRFAAGKVGMAFQFSGPYDGVVVPASASLHVGLDAGFSIEAWINPTTIELERPIVEWNSVSGGNPYPYGAHLWISVPVGYGAGPGCLYANLVDTAGGFHWLTSAGGLIKSGVYQHVALTYDKASGQAWLYLDGAVVASKNLGSFTPQTSYNLYLGRRPGGVAAAYSWAGELDEVSVYSRVLTANEIAAIHNAGSAGKCGPSTAVTPVITSQPRDRTVPAGSDAAFSVIATGSFPLRYQWLFGGNPIAGATASSLSLGNVQPAQAGVYAVVVTNDFGAATSADARLTVQTSPPVITQQPQSISVSPRATASFTALASGTAPLGYQWFFSGDPLAGQTTTTLALTNVQISQAGSYWMTATNPYGSASSLPAVLTVLPPPPCIPVPGGAVAWWRAESNTVDSVSTNDAAYAFTRPPAPNWFTNGKVGASFRIAPRSFFIAPATAELDVGAGDGLTVEGWIRPDAVSGYQPFVEWNDQRGNIGAGLMINFGYLEGYLTDTNTTPVRRVVMRSAPAAVTNAGWQHVALTFDKAAGLARMFVNGVPVTQTNLGAFRPQTQAEVYLGFRPSGTFGGGYFSGGLDEMTVYNRALSETEILAIAGADLTGKCLGSPPSGCTEPPNGLVSWWPGDGTSSEAMGTNNIVIFSPALYATGKVDRAFSLNGITSRIMIYSSPSLNFGPNADLSIEMWIKAGASNAPQPNVPLFEKRSTTAFPWIGYSLSLYQGRPAFTLASAPASTANMSTYFSTGADLRDNQFHHVAVTVKRASTNGGRLYVDGQLALTFNPVPRNGSLANSAHVYLGSSVTTVSNSIFGGLIDEPAIYNRALLAGEIMALHQAGASGKCKVPPTILVQPLSQTVTEGSNVTFSVHATGSPLLRYQWYRQGSPIQGATGSAFSFLVSSRTSSGALNVRVTNLFGAVLSSNAVLTVNRIPTALPQRSSPLEDSPAAITLHGSDLNQDPLTFAILTSPAHGTLSGTPPDLTYQPNADYFGPDSFTFKVNDGMADSGPATVSITVLPVNDPPFAQPQNFSVNEDNPLPIHLVAGDVEGDPLTYLVGAPAHGTLSGTPPDLVYQPVANYFGPDSFTFKVNDGQLDSASATVSIAVLPVNDEPEAKIVVSPLTKLPGLTNLVVVAPACAKATVILDASQSSDVENDPLQYEWTEGTNQLGTTVTVTNQFGPGEHTVTLVVSDATDAVTVTTTFAVLRPEEAVGTLALAVSEADLGHRHAAPLLATLHAAAEAFERCQPGVGILLLKAFQHQVRAQIAPLDPVLADLLDETSQEIIDVVAGDAASRRCAAFHEAARWINGRIKMRFSAPGSRTHYVEASTNLVHWEIIGVAEAQGDGTFRFEDPAAARYAHRYYRIASP